MLRSSRQINWARAQSCWTLFMSGELWCEQHLTSFEVGLNCDFTLENVILVSTFLTLNTENSNLSHFRARYFFICAIFSLLNIFSLIELDSKVWKDQVLPKMKYWVSWESFDRIQIVFRLFLRRVMFPPQTQSVIHGTGSFVRHQTVSTSVYRDSDSTTTLTSGSWRKTCWEKVGWEISDKI